MSEWIADDTCLGSRGHLMGREAGGQGNEVLGH